MTRKSRREIESAVEEIDSDSEASGPFGVVHEDPETGEWFHDEDLEEPIDPAVAEQADPLMILSETVVETDWSRDR